MKCLMLAVGLGIAASAGYAQDYPSRPISITVPNPPGGMNQIHAQPLSPVLERIAGQPAPVVNRPGGTAAVGTAYIANQPPDGYNLLVTTPNLFLVIEKDKLYGIKSPYALEQIAPVALLSADPLILVVHPSLPVKSVKELINLAKSKPGELVFSSSGPYGITHVPMAMFLDAAGGLKMRHLPTTGGGPAVVQALGGHAMITDAGPAAVFPYLQTGKMRALASWGDKRYALLPDMPTLKELGYNVEAYLWVGVFTTAGVPEPIFNKMRELIRKAASDPLFNKALDNARVVPYYLDTPDFRKFFDTDNKRLSEAVRKIGRI
jgi:tripartite-type tricarboxylate transporter receptor subunit TctC